MWSLFLGAIATFVIIGASILEGNWRLYVNMHSMLIVCGGTVAVLFFTTTANTLSSLVRSIRSLFRNDDHIRQHLEDLRGLSKSRITATPSNNELLRYSQELWEKGVDSQLFVVLLSQRKREIELRMSDAVQSLKNLAKYPPALGMAGTVMGMITLFANLDNDQGNIGYGLSTAMTATFFGLILTNALISPLSDRLHVRNLAHKRVFDQIYEILLLVNRGEAPSLIEEEIHERAS